MARVSWWKPTLVVSIFPIINLLIVFTRSCNSGFWIASCDMGRIFATFSSVWIFIVYLILVGLCKLPTRNDVKLGSPVNINKRIVIISTMFALLFLELILASLFGEPEGTWWFSPLLDSVAVNATVMFILPILPLIVVLILLADRLGII